MLESSFTKEKVLHRALRMGGDVARRASGRGWRAELATCSRPVASGGGPAPLNAHGLAITAGGAFGKQLPCGLQVVPFC